MDTSELIGYLASALVVVSLAMTSVVRLRAISLAGSVVFVVYGALIGSVPIMITNVAIACLNIWFLRNELGGRRALGAVVVPVDSPFLVDFLHYHLGDIHRFQPDFESPPPADDVVALLLMRDGLPAGALVGRRRGRDLYVLLDHVTKPVPRLAHLDLAVRQGCGRVPPPRRRAVGHPAGHRGAPHVPGTDGLHPRPRHVHPRPSLTGGLGRILEAL